jgi:hypothetical protein
MLRLTLPELHAHREDGTYLDFVKSVMKDFCFTIDRHHAKERVWFGSHTITINRNIAFNFFDRDVTADEALEPCPVMRGERLLIQEVRVNPEPDDPSAAYTVVCFTLDAKAYDGAVRSMDEILAEVGDLRTIPDVCFDDAPVIRLVRQLLDHPRLRKDREADWPDLLS